MQIHSLKLTVQDVVSKEGVKIATVFGTLILDTGDKAKTETGEDRLDAEGMTIPVLDNIDFVIPINSSKELKAVIQGLAAEALTLKNLEIAKKEGQLSHYVKEIVGYIPKPKKQGPRSIPKKK